MDRRFGRRVAAVALSAGVVAALASTGGASAAPAAQPDGPATTTAAAESPGLLDAVERDFDLSTDEAREQLAREREAARATARLADQLGSSFAGAWLTGEQELVVATTDAARAEQVRALGAEPEVVSFSESELDAFKNKLDEAATPDADEVTGWRVDVASNAVVVQARPGAGAAAAEFIEASGIDTATVRVEVSPEAPRLLYDVRGGDAYYPGASRCSVGFSVSGGFVTAGHCGGSGTPTSGYNQVSQGVVQAASFPGNDYGWVSVNSSWTPTPLVNRYSGSQTVTVAGSQEAPIGATVCRSGSTTGWRCGTITHKNQTVNYPQGTVHGLTRTTACAEPGDSGGSFLWGDQAQGVTSGGSGNCSSGGVTYFQPINEILSAYGLSLVTGSGGTPPSISFFHCESGGSQFFCSLSYDSPDPVDITWYLNGNPYSPWSGQTFASGGCSPGTTVQVEVSNQHGSDSSWVWSGCNPGPWP